MEHLLAGGLGVLAVRGSGVRDSPRGGDQKAAGLHSVVDVPWSPDHPGGRRSVRSCLHQVRAWRRPRRLVDPTRGYRRGDVGRNGENWLSIASILATITTLNTLLAALPRMFYGMAQKGQAPSILARVNKHAVPNWAIYLVTLMICLLYTS